MIFICNWSVNPALVFIVDFSHKQPPPLSEIQTLVRDNVWLDWHISVKTFGFNFVIIIIFPPKNWKLKKHDFFRMTSSILIMCKISCTCSRYQKLTRLMKVSILGTVTLWLVCDMPNVWPRSSGHSRLIGNLSSGRLGESSWNSIWLRNKMVIYKVVAYGRWLLTRSGRYERVIELTTW